MNDGGPWVAIAIAAGGWLVALLLLWAWWRAVRFVRLLKDLPTVKIRGIFVGLVETQGRVKCNAPLTAGISNTACVHHQWTVSEHWRRLHHYTDSKGRSRTEVRTGSDVVASGGQETDFELFDDTGTIGVRVNGADWRPRTTVDETVGRGHPLYHTKAPGTVVNGSTGERTFSESVVAIDDSIYVVGTAAIATEGSILELLRDRSEDNMLLISTATEKQVSRSRWWGAVAAFIFGLGCAGVGGFGILAITRLMESDMDHPEKLWIFGAGGGAAVFVALSFALWLVIVRNGVVRVRTRWQRAVSLVDVQLRRRTDLIPNLVAVTQGYAGHERSTQEAMAKLRAGAQAASTLAALAEAYPNLKADGAFMKLQLELSATEDRVAMARTFEIESRAAFLERLRTFPEGFVARMLGVSAPPPELGAAGRSAADFAAQATPSVDP